MSERVRVYRLVVMVVDHDDIGVEEMTEYLETTKYPNWCMNPVVISADVREVDWHDDHPLNQKGHETAFAALFDGEVSRRYIGPRGPLDTTDDACRLPADARETMTLAATVGVLTRRLARLAQACRLVVADARSDAATSNGPHLAAWAHDVATDLEAALREAEAMP